MNTPETNIPEVSVDPTLAFIGGGSTGQTVADYLNAIEAGQVSGVESATAYAIIGEADDGSRNGDLRTLYGINPVSDARRSISALSSNSYAAQIFETRFGEVNSLDGALQAVDTATERLTTALSYSDTSITSARMAEINGLVRDMSIDIYDRDPKKLKGLSIGHIVLAALAVEKDDFQAAIHEANELMATRAEVIPATVVPHRLIMRDGDALIYGEHTIDEYTIQNPNDVSVALIPDNIGDRIVINPRAQEAIRASQKVVVGPGSVYTSIVPALLPEGMPEELAAVKARGGDLSIVANLVTEPTETAGWTARRYVETTEKYAETKFTEVVLNDNTAALPEDRAVRFDRSEFETRADLRVHAVDLVKDEEVKRDPNDPLKNRSTVKHNMGAAAVILTPAATTVVPELVLA